MVKADINVDRAFPDCWAGLITVGLAQLLPESRKVLQGEETVLAAGIAHLAVLWLDGLLIFLCPCQHSLMVLMERMYSANPHFVRCIKPNSQKEPGVLDNQVVLLQVSKSRVLHRDCCQVSVGGQISPKVCGRWLTWVSPCKRKHGHTLYMHKDSEYLVVFMTQSARSRFCNLSSVSFLYHECNEVCLSDTRIHLCISPWMGTGTDSIPEKMLPRGDCSHPQPEQLWIEAKMGLLWQDLKCTNMTVFGYSVRSEV